MLLFIGHPVILWIALIRFNVIGDLLRNYACLAVFMADAVFALIGSIYVNAKKEGVI